MIYRPILSIVYSPLKRPLEGDAGSMLTLPTVGLLFYSKLPNSGDLVLDSDWVLDPSMHIGGYQLPAECEAYVPADGFWFDLDTHAPITRHEIEILSRDDVNVAGGAVHCSLSRGLAVYDSALVVGEFAAKILRYFYDNMVDVYWSDYGLFTDTPLYEGW